MVMAAWDFTIQDITGLLSLAQGSTQVGVICTILCTPGAMVASGRAIMPDTTLVLVPDTTTDTGITHTTVSISTTATTPITIIMAIVEAQEA